MVYYLSRQELAQGFDDSLAMIQAVLSQATEADYHRPTVNPKWNVHDTIAHLAGSAFGLLATIDRFLKGGGLPSEFDLDYWNERQVEKRRSRTMAELLEEVRQGHEKAKALLASLSDDDLRVRGTHPAGGEVSVAGVFFLIPQHELTHLADVAQALGVELPPSVSRQDPMRKDRLWWRLEDVRAEVKALAASLSPRAVAGSRLREVDGTGCHSPLGCRGEGACGSGVAAYAGGTHGSPRLRPGCLQ